MDDALDLDPLHALLPLDRPFDRRTARAAGIERAALERLLRSGAVRRVLRGVYASAEAPDTRAFRAAAVALAAGDQCVVRDRTSAWVHGVAVEALTGAPATVVPLDVLTRTTSGRSGSHRLAVHDLQRVDGLRVTTPLRTALDLGRLLPPDRALACLDALLRGGSFTHAALLAELPRMTGCPGVGQLRALAVQADARADGTAESVLRLHWHAARLPTPVPGMPVAAGGRLLRLALAVERRQFAAVVSGQLLRGEVTAEDLVALEVAGWRVVVLSEERLLHTDPATWRRHLEREFHQQLLAQTG